MTMRRLALILCALLMPLAAWAEEVDFTSTKPHALAYAPAEEPEWMPELLMKIAKGNEIRQHVLFRWKGLPAWLAVLMRNEYQDVISILRVQAPDRTEEKMRITDYMLNIIEPSGSDFFGDGTPLLGIHHYSGGSDDTNVGIIALRLDDSIKDATPKLYHSEGFSRDGRVIIAYYAQPKLRTYGCGNCIIRVRLAFRWQGNHLLPACKDYPQIYEETNQSKELRLEMQDKNFVLAFDAAMELVLNKLQAGHFDEAIRIYRKAKTEGVKKQDYNQADASFHDDTILHPHRNRSCPLMLSATKEEEDGFKPDYANILSHPLPFLNDTGSQLRFALRPTFFPPI